MPLRSKLLVAYARLKGSGNAFTNYHPYDFDLKSKGFEISSEGMIILHRERNTIEFEIVNPKFNLKVIGFNEKQPLVAKIATDMDQ